MIAQIRGELLEALPTYVVVDVNGMAFELGISAQTAASLPAIGATVALYTRMQVREDSISLFGFESKAERALFDRLVAISGVGAKLALAILSTYAPAQLHTIVLAEDDKGMAKVPGVGKKTAQRLILELKSIFAKDTALADIGEQKAPARVSNVGVRASAFEEVQMALLSMGFTTAEIELALDGQNNKGASVEELLSLALRRLGMDA